MKRRDFVKGLAVTTAAASTALGQQKKSSSNATTPPNTSTTTQGEQAVAPNTASAPAAQARQARLMNVKTPNIPISQPDTVAVTEVRYFTAARYATLTRFADLLMPASQGYPGALQAGAPEFLDFLIGASPADRQAMYNDGLDRLNADCLKKSGVSFAKASASQADAVIRPYLKGWINDHPPIEKHENFIALSHRDIRMATTNSIAWAQAAEAAGDRTPGVGLYVHPIDPGIETWVTRGVPKASAPLTKQAHS
jgi:hypothetical protein